MHTEWRERIPFYVAGTLPSAEAHNIKQHLESCASCRNYLNEWQEIRDVAIDEAQEAARPLPPLNIQALPKNPPIYLNGHNRENAISGRSQSRRPTNRLSLTLAAASIMMLLFVGLMIATNQNPETTASEPEANQQALQSNDIPACTVTSITEGAITLYSAPDITSDALTTIADANQAAAIARSDSHWYRVRYLSEDVLWMGWVDSERVELTGDCDALPLVNLTNPPE